VRHGKHAGPRPARHVPGCSRRHRYHALVLPLVEVTGGSEPPPSVDRLLDEHAAQFGAFMLSFVAIARLWLVHHRLFEQASSLTVRSYS
jgi:uncharacterized membrane protein